MKSFRWTVVEHLANRPAEKERLEVLFLGTRDIQEPLEGLDKGSSVIKTTGTCSWALPFLGTETY